MKILFVLHGFPPETRGGTETAVEALARAMHGAGHEVAVAAGSLEVVSRGADACRVEDLDGIPVYRLRRDDLYHDSWFKAYAPGASAAFRELLARLRPDVVHVHHWIRLSSDLVRTARAAGCLTAVTLHDYYTALASPVRDVGQDAPRAPAVPGYVGEAERAEAFAFHRRDFLDEVRTAHLRCAPSRAHAEGVQALAAGSLGQVEVTPPPLLRVPRRRRERNQRGRRLVVWGSHYAEKGLDVVLDALRQLDQGDGSTRDGWSLEVWGEAHEPTFRDAIRARAAGLPVVFRGAYRLDDLESCEADYAVLASRCHESYGLILDEALLLGLPVLAADLPAYREHGPAASCAWFPAGDAAALAALLRDDARLAALQAPAPPVVHDAAACAAQLLALYERAQQRRETGAQEHADVVTDAERAALLFRRAERRLWTALQQPDPPAPPD